jgi:hypothetical protein
MKSVEEMINQYKLMEQVVPSNSILRDVATQLAAKANILREVRYQYVDMAAGGDGGGMGYTPEGFNHEPTCREYNYPDMSDSYFKAVIAGMGW